MQARSGDSTGMVIEDNIEAATGLWRSDSCCVISIDILIDGCIMC